MPAAEMARMRSLTAAPPLELDRRSAGLLEKTTGVAHRFGRVGLVAHERHVTHHHGLTGPAGDQTGVVDHLVQAHRQGAVPALNDHAQRVAHQDQVEAGLIDQAGKGVDVGGHGGDLFAVGPSSA